MGSLAKWLAGLFMVAYVLSPVDFIPDLFTGIGWVDDLALVAVVVYFIWTGRLPSSGRWSRFARGFQSGTGSSHRKSAGSNRKQNDASTAGAGSDRPSMDPYTVLGVSPGAGKKEIREAYRKAAQAYHPDHVAHLGPELQALARQKFIEIKAAYEQLIKISE